MRAKVKQITVPKGKRIVCISDVHGYLDLFMQLLNKIEFTNDDILVVLGDLHSKGKTNQNHESLKYFIEISKKHNVHILRGNSDWVEERFTTDEKEWLENLPHIIDSQEYIFVHGGLTSENLSEQEAEACMKNDAFMEKGLSFKKYVITGHWPCMNYTHEIPCFNPIVNEKQRIIAIDGGIIPKPDMGQLNAFLIKNGEFSFDSIDNLPLIKIEKTQRASGGNLNITWFDRYIEPVDEGEVFSVYKHTASGRMLSLPKAIVYTEADGRLSECNYGTDYFLPVNAGDTVSLINRFGNRIFAKKNGTMGWIDLM